MYIYKYDYVVSKIKKLLKNPEKNSIKIKELIKQLDMQYKYYSRFDISKIEKDINENNLSLKRLIELRELLSETKKHIDNKELISKLVNGDYNITNDRKLVYTKKGLKVLFATSLLSIIPLANCANKGIEENESSKIEISKDDEELSNKDQGTKNKNIEILGDEKDDSYVHIFNTIDNKSEIFNDNSETKILNNMIEENIILEEDFYKTLENKKESVEKENSEVIININNDEEDTIEEILFGDNDEEDEINKIINDSKNNNIIETPEKVIINDNFIIDDENVNNSLPEIKNEDYGCEIEYKIEDNSKTIIEKEIEEREENIIIEEEYEGDLPSLDNVEEDEEPQKEETEEREENIIIEEEYEGDLPSLDNVEEDEEPQKEEQKEEIEEREENIIIEEEYEGELPSLDNVEEGEEPQKEEQKEETEEREENIITEEEYEGDLPSLDNVEEDEEPQKEEQKEEIEEREENIIIVEEYEGDLPSFDLIDEEESLENILYEENDNEMPTIVEEEDGSITNINTLSLSL